MDLFDNNLSSSPDTPLADRMRPTTLDGFVGQEELCGKDGVLRTIIEQDALHSIILWGPPGVGKTTLAHIISKMTGARFVSISAVSSGTREVRSIIERAREEKKLFGKKTILFIDEIHRFNKAQQDALLPSVEQGTIILIGATTENPSFEVISALLSRSRVFVMQPHTRASLSMILNRALSDEKQGLGTLKLVLDEQVKEALCDVADGDARAVLNILEIAATLARDSHITRELVAKAMQHKPLRYDRQGEEHYNVISAFIKSMRNSDASAALYWLARMIEAGEDPLFIARRIVIFASEDIGIADPHAITLALSVFDVVDRVGMPEGRIPLAHGTVYLARAKKNNHAYKGIEAALRDVREYGNLPVPLHLRNAVTKLMKEIGYGKGYQYAHDVEDANTDMQCLPDELKDKEYLPD